MIFAARQMMLRARASLSVMNEPFQHYAPGSAERRALRSAIDRMQGECPEVPCVVGGEEIYTGDLNVQVNPAKHAEAVARYHRATPEVLSKAIETAMEAQKKWSTTPWEYRAAILQRAAELLAKEYRYDLMAAVMLGTGKNVWQAEIDAAVETIDFWRFSAQYMQQIYSEQPPRNFQGEWNRLEYRPLEGFVYAVTPFNFIAIGANLCTAPAVMGNVVLWKPSDSAINSSWIVYKIMREAGIPEGVINFLPGDPVMTTEQLLESPDFAGLHFTGSSAVFDSLWKKVGDNVSKYRSYPRIVGETGGKNFHVAHSSADPQSFVNQTVRAAFEYQGQKCSACSRAYVPSSLWPTVLEGLQRQIAEIRVGQPDDFSSFMTAVIHKGSFDRVTKYIEEARASRDCEIVAGGKYDDSEGYFIEPTVIVTKDPKFATMTTELFGPVLTVHVYDDDKFSETLDLVNETSNYALTGSIFANDTYALVEATEKLRDAAGNFYINDKSTGSIVGQQPFGGSRKSGTNDKAGSPVNLMRWVTHRTVKQSTLPLRDFRYPHMSTEE